jgi:hypothetical protein
VSFAVEKALAIVRPELAPMPERVDAARTANLAECAEREPRGAARWTLADLDELRCGPAIEAL